MVPYLADDDDQGSGYDDDEECAEDDDYDEDGYGGGDEDDCDIDDYGGEDEGPEDDNQIPTTKSLLVFDRPFDSAHDYRDQYKWIHTDDIPGSDVCVVAYSLEKYRWDYEMNPCTLW